MLCPKQTRVRALASGAVAVLAVAVSSCGGDAAPEQAADEATASQTSQPAPTAESSPSPSGDESPAETVTEPSTTVPTEDAPDAGDVRPPAPGSSPKRMLLRAAEVPGLNDQHRWRTIATEDSERGQPVWACQVTDFTSIGATEVWVRRFVGDPGGGESAKARSAVVTFVDDQSAQRAYAVLRAWHDRCEEQLQRNFQRVRVDARATAVDVEDGQAEWRMATYGPLPGEPDASYFDATGYVLEGSRISLTTMVSVGQDYNYPRGEEPIVGAVANSAVKLLG